jgi:hypothetical protein
MKYFTPDLVVRFGSKDDAVADAAEREWEEAGDRYVAYLDTIRPHLSAGLRAIDESYYLHDSLIRGMGQQGSTFSMILQLDTPPQSILTFTYDLVEPPVITRDVLPQEQRTTGDIVSWQYNEIEIIPGDPPTWREALLLSNGWELALHFRDVQVQEAQAILPVPRNGVSAGVSFVLQHASPG